MADAYHGPSFLKKIVELPMRGLTLPSSFLKTHGKLLRSDVILEGPSRRKWKVVVNGTFPSSNVTFGQGWEEFVTAHVLQLGDQLCFTLTADSRFQVEVYDESGCQKTSAIDATDSAFSFSRSGCQKTSAIDATDSAFSFSRSGCQKTSAIDATDSAFSFSRSGCQKTSAIDATDSAFSFSRSGCQKTSAIDATDSAFSFSRRPSTLQIPPMAGSNSTARRLSQIQNLDDPALNIKNPDVYTKVTGEEALSDLQWGSVTDAPLLLRRESALESIRRDSARRSSAVRDPYVLPSTDEASVMLQSNNIQRGLVPDYLLEFADCFVDMEKILSEPPDLRETEPLVIEDIPPCWELHEHTPAVNSSSLEKTKRVSTLFSSPPPDSELLPPISHLETIATHPRSLINQEMATKRDSTRETATKRESTRLSSLGIPLVSELVLQTPTSTTTRSAAMRLSQIQNLDDLTLKAENLALYTKAAAEKAISDIQLESATSFPLTGSPLSRRESSIFKAESIGVQTKGVN